MDATPHLHLPLLFASQAQKHVTHNEALVALDALVQLAVTDRRSSPPVAADEGQRFIVASPATGEFAGHTGAIAAWSGGAWTFYAAQPGWIAWSSADGGALAFDGIGWTELRPTRADRFGVGTAADPDNRLAVASPAVLFDHAGTDSRVKVNKHAAVDTASLVFQHGYSGRAEMGLAGNDDFAVKVSPDGAGWQVALTASASDGSVTAPRGLRIPDGAKIANHGTAATSGLELEGGGNLGKVALVVKSVSGLTGALFEQRAAPDSGLDLIDFGLKTLTKQVNMRVESRVGAAVTGAIPELQFGDRTSSSLVNLLALSARQTIVQSPLALKSYLVASLPSASAVQPGAMVYVSNAADGAVPAFSDGAAWRRVTDRAVVS